MQERKADIERRMAYVDKSMKTVESQVIHLFLFFKTLFPIFTIIAHSCFQLNIHVFIPLHSTSIHDYHY